MECTRNFDMFIIPHVFMFGANFIEFGQILEGEIDYHI